MRFNIVIVCVRVLCQRRTLVALIMKFKCIIDSTDAAENLRIECELHFAMILIQSSRRAHFLRYTRSHNNIKWVLAMAFPLRQHYAQLTTMATMQSTISNTFFFFGSRFMWFSFVADVSNTTVDVNLSQNVHCKLLIERLIRTHAKRNNEYKTTAKLQWCEALHIDFLSALRNRTKKFPRDEQTNGTKNVCKMKWMSFFLLHKSFVPVDCVLPLLSFAEYFYLLLNRICINGRKETKNNNFDFRQRQLVLPMTTISIHRIQHSIEIVFIYVFKFPFYWL